MTTASKTVLITGGNAGIGLALAERFLAAGSEVVICGRREDRLQQVRDSHPGICTRVCDVGSRSDREALVQWATSEFPSLDVLVNNAGVQRRIDMVDGEPWEETESEITINLEAPIHLSMLFIPHLLKQTSPAIVNVTSGLSFVPLANVPVYCATKAALHSFTLSLRHQLSTTPIEVIEIIPPAVDTDLGGVGLHTFGVPLDEFADSTFTRLSAGETEIAYGTAEHSRRASQQERDEIFARMNGG